MAAKRAAANVSLPEGFLYGADFLSASEEAELLRRISELAFQPFNFQGYVARRRIVEYGWEYDFTARKAAPAAPLPQFLFGLRDRAADFAGIKPEEIVEAVITEYPPGAPIGWKRVEGTGKTAPRGYLTVTFNCRTFRAVWSRPASKGRDSCIGRIDDPIVGDGRPLSR